MYEHLSVDILITLRLLRLTLQLKANANSRRLQTNKQIHLIITFPYDPVQYEIIPAFGRTDLEVH